MPNEQPFTVHVFHGMTNIAATAVRPLSGNKYGKNLITTEHAFLFILYEAR